MIQTTLCQSLSRLLPINRVIQYVKIHRAFGRPGLHRQRTVAALRPSQLDDFETVARSIIKRYSGVRLTDGHWARIPHEQYKDDDLYTADMKFGSNIGKTHPTLLGSR